MGRHYNLNYLFIVIVSHVILHCFALDLINKNFRRPQHSQTIPEKHQYSLNNANQESDLYNKTKSARHSLHWKWKRAGTDVNNYNDGNHFLRIFKMDTKMQITTTDPIKGSYISRISRYVSKPTTPSYIEFDYLHENQHQENYDSLKRLGRFGFDNGVTKWDNYSTSRSVRPSIVSYHLFKDPYTRQELITPPKSSFSKNRHQSFLSSYFQPANNFRIDNEGKPKNKPSVSDSISNIPFSGGHIVTVEAYLKDTEVPTTKSEITPKVLQCTAPTTVSTIPNDRVKFFEIYDNNTVKPPNKKNKLNESSEIHSHLSNRMSEKNCRIPDHHNGKLGRCDNMNKTKVEIKHNYKKRSFNGEGSSAISNKIRERIIPKSLHSSMANNTFIFQTESIFSGSEIMPKTAVVPWSSYPFASVYVYKPTQTHCDAAGISPHWLLAAGSCLSRHDLVHSLHARSAFVTYCGEHWRRPERIAYVKRSVVHPKFNPRDEVRRVMYNIGLIQVSSSMAASCPGWSPIALISHQFSARLEGSEASAVGWGLDRYGAKHRTEKLPHWPLTLYKALVYYDSCPGSSTYSTAKQEDGHVASNVYCLLLPPYTNEESDPVHGGLLLFGGKLVALYLQEERHPSGPQSAQYTGVWRLLPWIMDVAREPDDAEATFDV